jgi:tRNA threonylcarbamoyladenosine biosynthesis protein TsaB
MLILAADTSGKNGSLALARVSAGQLETLEVVPLAGGTFSAQLVPQIAALLHHHGYSKREIDALVVVSGPGSFTGLRVGLAAIKGLAEVLGKPIAAVSLLEAAARSASSAGRVLAALDAGRGEAYCGEYEVAAGHARMISEKLLKQSDIAGTGAALVITPDRTVAEAIRAAAAKVEEIPYPRADVIARLGWEKLQRGEITTPEALEANYIRRSDAEMALGS